MNLFLITIASQIRKVGSDDVKSGLSISLIQSLKIRGLLKLAKLKRHESRPAGFESEPVIFCLPLEQPSAALVISQDYEILLP